MNSREQSAQAPQAAAQRSGLLQRAVLIVQIGVVLLMSALLMSQGKFPSIGLMGLFLFCVLLWRAKDRFFLLNFSPFILLLATYETLRGLADELKLASLHITDLIVWEKTLCGGVIPAHALQQAWGSQPLTGLVDLLANSLYMSHFVAPVILALILWQYRRANYWPFLLGLTLLSYSAFLTYVFFPAAPPWLATYFGFLQDQPVTLAHSVISLEAIMASANPVAAMPSLHAAYPLYLSLYCLFMWKRKALPVLILPAGVAVAAMYLGHHYLIDILAGWVYALVVFVFAVWLSRSQLIPAQLQQAYETMRKRWERE